MGYKFGQEVVVLARSTIKSGIIVDGMLNDVHGEFKPHYKVSLKGSSGRWFSEDELAPADAPAAGRAGERSMLVFHDIEEANLAIDTCANDLANAQAELAALRQQLAAAEAMQTFLAGVPVTQLAIWNANGATLHKLLKNIYTHGVEFTLTEELMRMFGIVTDAKAQQGGE